jgi:hypothetical protein
MNDNERDAARYRWLRDHANDTPKRAPMVVMVDGTFEVTWRDALYGAELDDAIDAAASLGQAVGQEAKHG